MCNGSKASTTILSTKLKFNNKERLNHSLINKSQQNCLRMAWFVIPSFQAHIPGGPWSRRYWYTMPDFGLKSFRQRICIKRKTHTSTHKSLKRRGLGMDSNGQMSRRDRVKSAQSELAEDRASTPYKMGWSVKNSSNSPCEEILHAKKGKNKNSSDSKQQHEVAKGDHDWICKWIKLLRIESLKESFTFTQIVFKGKGCANQHKGKRKFLKNHQEGLKQTWNN